MRGKHSHSYFVWDWCYFFSKRLFKFTSETLWIGVLPSQKCFQWKAPALCDTHVFWSVFWLMSGLVGFLYEMWTFDRFSHFTEGVNFIIIHYYIVYNTICYSMVVSVMSWEHSMMSHLIFVIFDFVFDWSSYRLIICIDLVKRYVWKGSWFYWFSFLFALYFIDLLLFITSLYFQVQVLFFYVLSMDVKITDIGYLKNWWCKHSVL